MPRTKQFDREVVLGKAMELFWTKGFHATSVSDLVEYLGINRASMYGTFGDKDRLFREALQLYQRKGQAYFADLDQALARKPTREFLEEFLLQELKQSKEDVERKGCMVVNTTTELATQSPEIHEMVCANRQAFTDLFGRIMQIARDRNEIPPDRDPDTIAQQLFIFFNGLKVVVKIEADPTDLKDAVRLQMDYIFGGN